jgi:hypothetical protein
MTEKADEEAVCRACGRVPVMTYSITQRGDDPAMTMHHVPHLLCEPCGLIWITGCCTALGQLLRTTKRFQKR